MFKLMKYEFRRNLGTLIILYAAILGLEAYSLFGMLTKSEEHTGISFSLLVLCGFAIILFVFIIAIQSYSKELGSKYSYMTFMTPNTTYSIIGSKLLSTGLIALITTVIGVLLVVLDYNIFINQFPDVKNIKEVFEQMLTVQGYDLGDIFASVLVYFIVLWLGIFTWICVAYFAITLSATAFANKKFRGVISFVIFVVIAIIISRLTNSFPKLDLGSGMVNKLLAPLYSYILDIVVIICSFIASAILLEKKVSL